MGALQGVKLGLKQVVPFDYVIISGLQMSVVSGQAVVFDLQLIKTGLHLVLCFRQVAVAALEHVKTSLKLVQVVVASL